MASVSTLSSEVAISADTTDMPALKEIIHELRESTGSVPQARSTKLTADDLRVQQALALPQLSETDLSTEETNHIDHADVSTEKTAWGIVGALNSAGKCISVVLDSIDSSITTESEEQFIGLTTQDQTYQPTIDNIQPCPAPTSVQTTVTPTKKQHIMISYNRSCEEACRKIRNNLKGLKYKVWMDVYDMHDNFIDGMAKAIRNSYIVLMCINRKYDGSFWCRKEAEDIAIKRIKFIPCFMEEQFPLEDWLDFLVGSNVWIDFSKEEKFNESFDKLIVEITSIEEKLATYPRETPPVTPLSNSSCTITSNPTVTSFDTIIRNFKTWIEENRHDLKRSNRKQSAQLINQLIQGLENDHKTSEDENKKELLEQLLSCTSKEQDILLPQFINNLTTSNYLMIRGLLFIMAIWAVRVVFKKN